MYLAKIGDRIVNMDAVTHILSTSTAVEMHFGAAVVSFTGDEAREVHDWLCEKAMITLMEDNLYGMRDE